MGSVWYSIISASKRFSPGRLCVGLGGELIALELSAQAEPAIQRAIGHIESGMPFSRPQISFLDALCSGPVWKTNCTHCMACICRCPKEAIEYGRHSVGLPRYVFGKEDG